MKRPPGVTISAWLLALLGGVLLLAQAFLFLAILTGPQPQREAATVGALILSVPLVALVIWIGFTVYGLLHLKPSARTSMQILSVLLVLLALVGFAGALMVLTLVPHTGSTEYQAGFAVGVLLPAAALLALGVGWLIYFNLRAVADSFRPPWLQPSLPGALPRPYPPQYSPARPAFPDVQHTGPYAHRRPGRFDAVPASIQLLGWLGAFASVLSAVFTLTPIPVFLCGWVVDGLAGHLCWAALAIFNAVCAWGLLALRSWGRILAYCFLAFAAINSALSITPYGLNALNLYMERFLDLFHFPGQPAVHIQYTLGLMLPSFVLGLALDATAAYFIYKHRGVFRSSRPE